MGKKKRKSKYKEPPRAKVGRCWYVKGYDKKPLIGLSWDRGNGYFFPTHFRETEEYKKTGKRPNFSKDYDTAIMLFRQWRDKHKNIVLEEFNQQEIVDVQKEYPVDDSYARGDIRVILTEELIIQKSKELFGKYPPSVIAEKYGMPSLAKIDYVDDLHKPHSLREIGDCYFNRIEFTDTSNETAKEVHKVRKSWKRFCEKVGVEFAKELTKKRLREFYNDIYSEYKRRKWSTTWIRGHFERVKRVFNHAVDSLDNVDDIIEAKLRCASVLKSPKAEVQEKAYRITRNQFHRILDHSSVEERCMWLLSMNLAYYSVDIATLPLSAINIEDKVVVFRRGKTGNHRSGVLWQRTIDSIIEYQKVIPHDGETLFLEI
ncbi:MAG: hypothetical protein JRI56_11760 [Deltaproteobacteria bacterium]|nr:hypothetical protein [Deltaproteobacteria bacterium]